MDELLSEKEQIEKIRQWFAENGYFLVAGLVLGISVIAGWAYWQNYQTRHAVEASTLYSELVVAVSEKATDKAAGLGNKLATDYQDTPYAAQGALALAKLYVEADVPDQAAAELRKAIATGKDERLVKIARLRLARVLVHQGHADEALELMDVANAGTFVSRYHEVRGDAYVAKGDSQSARGEYDSALDTLTREQGDPRQLQMKRDDLSVAEPVVAGAGDDS